MGKLVENFEKLTAEETDDADFRIYKSQNLNYPFSHRHSFFEFYYITGGKGYDIINGEKYALEEGAFLLFSPYHIHKTVSSPGKPPEGYVGCISMNCVLGSGTLPVNFDKLLSSSGKDEVYMKFAGEEHMTLSAIFEKAAGEYKTKKSYREYMIAAFISIILVMFKRASGAAEQPERHFAGRGNMWDIIRYVHNNYSENITLESLSEKFFINKSHISETFKKYTGNNFSSYLQNVRIKHACGLLRSTDLSVTEISVECGFKRYETFSRAFRKITGMTAHKYRGQ